nr:FAD-dependent oxidoreductase [Nakamurella lactea]
MNAITDADDVVDENTEAVAAVTAVTLPSRDVPVVAESEVIVVGGGPAGVSAAVAAARSGASVTLLERYSSLGGLASGGMVLVLDDMCNGSEITVTGIVAEYVERLEKYGLAVSPPESERFSSPEMWAKWGRWGTFDFQSHVTPKPICYAVSFDPDGWKRVSNDLVQDSGVNLRLHSWFSQPIVTDGRMTGVVVETKSGPQAIRGEVVIDTTGDIDVASRSGAEFVHDKYLVTLVFRLAGVDTDAAEAYEQANPRETRAINRKIKRLLGGAWELWWLKTPSPGVVWCNCPHLTGFDGADPVSLTMAEFEARERIASALELIRQDLPGFENCYLLDVAQQIGVRQTRLLQGEYVVTKEDITTRRHFADSVARGRDYYTPYRALLPRGVDQLLVAGRHYSASPQAQRMSREIPPCMAMGQAAGIAGALAVSSGDLVRDVPASLVQAGMREQGADPGDVPSANATIDEELELGS